MAFIEPIHYENASAKQRAAWDEHAKIGRITNMKRTLLHNVPAFHALMEWYPLRDEALTFLPELDVNLFCHTISTQNDCLVCSMFFRKILKDAGIDIQSFRANAQQQALMDFGSAMVKNPHGIDDSMHARLAKLFSPEQIVLLTAFGAMMIATNLINSTLKVELDGYLQGYV